MEAAAKVAEPKFPWALTQERVDMLADALFKLETLMNVCVSGSLAAENVAKLITDLRADCCVRGGAADPFPHMPMSPRFEDTDITPDPEALWVDEELGVNR